MTICTKVDAATMEAHRHLAALMNWSDMVAVTQRCNLWAVLT